jgi:hypothetical protein
MGLVLPDLIGAKLIRWFAEVTCEALDGTDVLAYRF